jgi:hypothetical protein
VKRLALDLFLVVIFLIFSVHSVMAAPGDVWLHPPTSTVSINSDFDMEVHLDSGNLLFGVYQFSLTFNPTFLQVNTSIGTNGVEAGPDGFLASAAVDNVAGTIVVNGFDIGGKGPGIDLHALTIHFTSLGNEVTDTPITLLIEQLGNPLGDPIGTQPRPYNGQGALVTIISGNPLSVSVDPSCSNLIMGTVESNPPGINCPGDCSETYQPGTPVTLSATPVKGNVILDHWGGDCAGTVGDVCNLVMDTGKNVQAIFKVLIGDVDCDGSVTILDALLTARRSAGLPMDQTNWCGDQPGPFDGSVAGG